MVTKFKISDVLEGEKDDKNAQGLLFWLTGLCAETVEIFGTVEVYRPQFMMAPELTKSIRCKIYPVREMQNAQRLFETGSLLLFAKDCVELTRNERDPLKITVTIHELNK